jgi:polyhydroxybutyrate depolymerase
MRRRLTTLSFAVALAGTVAGAPAILSAGPCDDSRTISSGGVPRQYILHIPVGYDGHKPLPLVLILHGFGGTACSMVGTTGMSNKADAEGFFVAYLDGTPCVPSDVCTDDRQGWNSGIDPLREFTVDDVRFVRDVLRQLQEHFRIDVRRIYAAGFSAGAFMSHRLGAELSDLLAAVAVVEGTIGLGQPPDIPFLTIPEPVGSIPVVIVHGMHDTHLPYDGGQGDAGLYAKSVADAVAFWTAANRCNGDSSEMPAAGDGNLVTSYAGCFANSDVVLFTIANGVHAWPRVGDPENTGFPATDAIWEFFAKHPRT